MSKEHPGSSGWNNLLSFDVGAKRDLVTRGSTTVPTVGALRQSEISIIKNIDISSAKLVDLFFKGTK